MAAQTSYNILRFSAHILHVDVSGATFNGTVLPGGVCQTLQRGHNLNTCDMKTDFGSLYVNGKTPSGMFCGNYLFHWANGLESLTDAPSTRPTSLPSSKPSKVPTVVNPVPTRVPLPSGQYYFSPTSQLIAGSNVCNVVVRTNRYGFADLSLIFMLTLATTLDKLIEYSYLYASLEWNRLFQSCRSTVIMLCPGLLYFYCL